MEPTRRNRSRLREHLARLKRRGCNLLVAGEVDVATRRAASRRLFGDPDVVRDRVLLTVGDAASSSWLPADGRVIEADVGTRSAATSASPDAPSGTPIAAAVAAEVPPRREPGRFRLGVTSLAPLLEGPGGAETVTRLRETVSDARGMGHYHLSAPVDAERTREIAAAFDAVLELRNRSRGPEERWHLDAADAVTSWMSLTE